VEAYVQDCSRRGVAAVSATPAIASDWYRVGQTDTALTYLDAETISGTGRERTAWIYRLWLRPTNTGIIATRIRMVFNCTDHSCRNLYFISYSDDGTSDSWEAENRNTEYAAPDTVAESMLRFACGELNFGVRLGNVTPERDADRFR